MELLIFLLLSPTILAQSYSTNPKPNDEPFLPILPQNPYNPKLIKRGIDREVITQLTPELYVPKADARDSYAASYSNNFQRESYFPSYNLYPKTSVSALSPYYGSTPYPAASSPFSLLNAYSNPYASSPYAASAPYSGGLYPGYFYPPPPVPGYYNHPYSPYPPPHPHGPYPRPPKSDYDSEDDSDDKESSDDKKSEGKKSKHKDSGESRENQFIDGGNYISDSSKDLDSQSSSYKSPNPRNKLDDADQQKTIYKIINVSGQQNPEYLLTSSQAKAHLENLMRQVLVKILAQNAATQAPRIPYAYNVDPNKNSQNYVALLNRGVGKTGLAYVVSPTVYNKVNHGQIGPTLPAQTDYTKNLKYPNLQYGQKPVTRVTLERSPGLYLSPLKTDKGPTTTQSPDYADYDSPQSNSATRNQPEDSVSYSTQNVVTAKEPQAFSYQYSSYHPDQPSAEIEVEKDSAEEFESKEKSSR